MSNQRLLWALNPSGAPRHPLFGMRRLEPWIRTERPWDCIRTQRAGRPS